MLYNIEASRSNIGANPRTGQTPLRTDTHTLAVKEELMNFTRARSEMRDPTSSKLNIKGPRAADASRKLDMKVWNAHMDKFPELMLETARQNRLIDQDIRTRDLQEFQFKMVQKIEGSLKESLRKLGHDVTKFRIGGHDRGTYERFYRVEPGRYMSKPQFLTGIRRAFGDDLIKSSGALGKLYDSYDPDRRDEMDWRAFLFLLTIFMQPHDNCFTHLRWAFAIYSSIGTLDFEDCPEKMSISEVKDMIVVPTLMRFRKDIKTLVEHAWLELSAKDEEAGQISMKHGDNAIDKIKLSYKMFSKLFTETSLAQLMGVHKTFGILDTRPWLYNIEVEYYHKSLTVVMEKVRRDSRNEIECNLFVSQIVHRIRKFHFHCIVQYVARRARVRKMILLCSVRWRNENVASSFDKWRYVVLVNSIVKQIQRVVRGFNARRRAQFIKRIQKRVVKVQAGVRQIRKRVVFMEYNKKRVWAAKYIQKMVRGRSARRLVSSRIQAKYDLGVRIVEKKRVAYYKERYERAVWKIQMMGRRYFVRCSIIRKVENRIRLQSLAAKMDMDKEKARISTELYKKEIEEWYSKAKEEYDLTVLVEGASSEGRKKIIAYRSRQRELERLEREASKEELLEKQEEQRIEAWIKTWEVRIVRRVADMGVRCKNVLIMPETPDDIILAKDLSARIKKHVKVVLRRADKQKIPMEIPEAQDLAKKEIIDLEMEEERKRAKAEMREEAEAGQKALEEKHSNDWQKVLESKERLRGWGIFVVVSFFRQVVARKKLRKRAFDRYEKHFDIPTRTYFYRDKQNGRAFWVKPKSLDAYDVKGDDGWVILFDKNDDKYYYQPSTWRMQWEEPFGSALCMGCDREFSCVRFTKSKRMVCENCCLTEVTEMLKEMRPQEIYFKPFKGNVDNAVSTVFSYIKETNWWKYLLETDPSLKLSAEDAALEEKIKQAKSGVRGEACGRCKIKKDNEGNEKPENTQATKLCDQCQEYFCDNCYSTKHNAPPWNNHSFVDYEPPKPKKERIANTKANEKKKLVAKSKSGNKNDDDRDKKNDQERGRSTSPKAKKKKSSSQGKSKSPGKKKGTKKKDKDDSSRGRSSSPNKKKSDKGKSKSPGAKKKKSGKSKSPGPKKKKKDVVDLDQAQQKNDASTGNITNNDAAPVAKDVVNVSTPSTSVENEVPKVQLAVPDVKMDSTTQALELNSGVNKDNGVEKSRNQETEVVGDSQADNTQPPEDESPADAKKRAAEDRKKKMEEKRKSIKK